MDPDITRPHRVRDALIVPVLVAGALVVACVAPGRAQDQEPATRMFQPGSQSALIGTTRPSKEMDLAFTNAGRVAQVTVKEGDRIEAGQLLMQQDVAVDEAYLRSLQVKADIVARVELARTQLELAKLELKAAEDAQPAISPLEVERALLEVEAAETRILEEERQGKMAAAEVEQQQAILEQRTLNSPDSGVVQKLDAAVGEIFGPQAPALKIVKIDPLHVEMVDVPAAQVMKLKVGDPIQVRYEGDDAWQEARIIFINPVGDPYGDWSRLAFKAELANPDGHPAGLRIQVRLPGTEATAAGSQP